MVRSRAVAGAVAAALAVAALACAGGPSTTSSVDRPRGGAAAPDAVVDAAADGWLLDDADGLAESTAPLVLPASPGSAPTVPAASPAPSPRLGCPRGLPTTWVARENARPGSSAWRRGLGSRPPVTAYAEASTARCGDTVWLHVRSTTSFVVQVWRMGYYAGHGARLVATSARHGAVRQSAATGPGNAANWTRTLSLDVDARWLPGAYLLKLVPTSGHASFVPLTVGGSRSSALFVMATSTYQAYNLWGGASTYYDAAGRSARRLRLMSSLRPYAVNGSNEFGDGRFLQQDLPAVYALEQWGTALDYTSDEEVDSRPAVVDGHSLVVLGGHSEYMTPTEREALEAAVARGTNLLNLGANTAYWRVRALGRGLYANYRSATEDTSAPSPEQVTTLYRSAPAADPESLLWGSMFGCLGVHHLRGTVVGASGFPWRGSGATEGMALPGVVDGEIDQVYSTDPRITPEGAQVIGYAGFPCAARGGTRRSWDAMYTARPGRGGVLSTGTFGWICALTRTCTSTPLATQRVLAAATRSFVREALVGPLGDSHPSVPNTKVLHP